MNELTVKVGCVFCGTVHTFRLDAESFKRWQAGENIQNVFTELTPAERELLVSHTCESCFDKLYENDERDQT